ncbi:MAG: ABC transporter permease [Bacteroidota bacterium]
MSVLKYLLQKEFRQIFRDPSILRIIFVMPALQLIVIPMAADYEVKNINLAVADHDHSVYTQQIVQKIKSSGYFKLVNYSSTFQEAVTSIEADKADIVLEIPAKFEQNIVREDHASLFIAVNAVNGMKANLGAAYLQNIIQNYNNQIRTKWIQFPPIPPQTNIKVSVSNWFNPMMSYKYFMVPAVLATLLTMLGTFLTALNIVREKEIGTIEQINVTPIKKYHFILGKLIPFWVLGLVVLTIGFLIMRFGYQIHPVGNMLIVYLFASLYLLSILGLGLLISTYADTQQQAMLISFFLLMIFIMLGGLFTPIDSMPTWVQKLTWLNPVSYFIDVVRMVVLKGSGLADIKNHILVIIGFAIFLNSWAVWNYKKTS